MWKNLISKSCLLPLFFVSSLALGVITSHLEELKSKFPYGLLGDDYEVLNINDFAINACIANPKPFNPSAPSLAYQYWQCFESKTISFDCDSDGVPDKYEGVMGLVVVRAFNNQSLHEYIERRLWPIKSCKSFIKDARTLLKGARYACISGTYIQNEVDDSGKLTQSWIIDRIKTKKGCEGRHCKFTKKFKQDGCSDLKL